MCYLDHDKLRLCVAYASEGEVLDFAVVGRPFVHGKEIDKFDIADLFFQ